LNLDTVFEGIVNPPDNLFEKKRLEKKSAKRQKEKRALRHFRWVV
jgi:hypothetical protein